MTSKQSIPLKAAFEELLGNARLAVAITRGERRRDMLISGGLLLGGILLSWYSANYVWFARSGAALSTYSFALAWRSTSFDRSLALLDLNATTPEKAVARSDVGPFMQAVQRRRLADYLALAACGTFVWGFGDLVGQVL
jgi:hypothetical protein